MNLFSMIQKIFTGIFSYVFGLISFEIRKLRFVGKSIPIEDKVSDFFEIFRATIIYFIFNLLAFLVFIELPQGKDVILLVIENLSRFNLSSLISLLAGLIIWSIISEFGARYKIYVTDNSGMSLSDERVNFRKEAQKFVSAIYLLLPVIIVILSVIIVSINNIKDWQIHVVWPFAVVIMLLILIFALLSKFYLDDAYIEKLRNSKVWFKVDLDELNWVNKLYGIYNDHVFMIRKANNFKDKNSVPDPDIKNTYDHFTQKIESLPEKNDDESHSIESFPRDYIIIDELPPSKFEKVTYKPDNFEPIPNPDRGSDKTKPEFINKKNPDGYYRWIYKNNSSFYKTLHLQLHIIAISSLIFILLISTKFLISYNFIGSPALVCLSFGCWLGVYTGLFYIDSRFKSKIKISVRWVLLIWFFIVSFINHDHPVRMNGDAGFTNQRMPLNEHFISWTKNHLLDTSKISWIRDINKDSLIKCICKKDSINETKLYKIDTTIRYPVFFITAEGGALRTGAFTAMLLARLQDTFKTFKNHIYAFSTVSGGSVGISFFNAINYLEPDTTAKIKNYNQLVTRKFFSQDQLSPVLAKLFYADVLNYFWPWHIDNFDRAIALEKAWEHSYATVFDKPNDKNVFSENFMTCYQNNNPTNLRPAWFINTTEVETGLQCYISNVKADSFLFDNDRDLLSGKIRSGINYSTAVNFSSRFPIFSPSAALYQNDDQTYHYVDGGYVENTGAKTMLEVLQSLHKIIDTNKILPYVIQLKFGDSTHFAQTGFLNEISSILSGIYNTRAGSSTTYTALLKNEVKSLHGQFIEVPLSASSQEVPMSWVFSERSLANLDTIIDHVMKDTLNDLHTKLPYFQRFPHEPLK